MARSLAVRAAHSFVRRGGINRLTHGIGTMVGNIGKLLARRRIVERKTAVGFAPGTVDITAILIRLRSLNFMIISVRLDLERCVKGA